MARNRNNKAVEVLDNFEEVSDGFAEGEVQLGNVLSSFNFLSEPEVHVAPTSTKAFEFNFTKPPAETLTDTRKIKTEANIATPAVDGEIYSIGRYYKLRYSTAKMLNEIKAAHSDVNVYMNTIVDDAIRHYYDCLFKKELS